MTCSPLLLQRRPQKCLNIFQKSNPKSTQNCSKLHPDSAQNCSKLLKIAQNCSKLLKIAQNCSKLLKMAFWDILSKFEQIWAIWRQILDAYWSQKKESFETCKATCENKMRKQNVKPKCENQTTETDCTCVWCVAAILYQLALGNCINCDNCVNCVNSVNWGHAYASISKKAAHIAANVWQFGRLQPYDDGRLQPYDDGRLQPYDDGLQPYDDGLQPYDDEWHGWQWHGWQCHGWQWHDGRRQPGRWWPSSPSGWCSQCPCPCYSSFVSRVGSTCAACKAFATTSCAVQQERRCCHHPECFDASRCGGGRNFCLFIFYSFSCLYVFCVSVRTSDESLIIFLGEACAIVGGWLHQLLDTAWLAAADVAGHQAQAFNSHQPFAFLISIMIFLIPESLGEKGSSNSDLIVGFFILPSHHIFTSSHLHIFSSSHLHILTSSHLHILSIVPLLSLLHLHIFSSSHLTSRLHIFKSSHLLIFTSSHPHIFTSSQFHILSSSLFINFTSHLLIFTFSHLHIFTSSHPHIHIFTLSLDLLLSSHLHILTSSHSHIFTPSHLNIFSSSHTLIFTSSHFHIFSSLHLHIITSSHFHTLTSSHSLLPSCSLALLLSCPLALLPSAFSFFSISLLRCGAVTTDGMKRNLSTKTSFAPQKLKWDCDFTTLAATRHGCRCSAILFAQSEFQWYFFVWQQHGIGGRLLIHTVWCPNCSKLLCLSLSASA